MKKFFIKSLNGMAFGLFSSLIVGLILKQIGTLFNIEFLIYLGGFSQLLMGAGIGVGVAYALESPVLILISSAITGMYGAGSINFVDGQAILKVGEPMGAYFSVIFGLLISKQIAGKTKFDIILLPMTTIIFGCLLGKFFAPYISAVISEIGVIVNKTTELRPNFDGTYYVCNYGNNFNITNKFSRNRNFFRIKWTSSRGIFNWLLLSNGRFCCNVL